MKIIFVCTGNTCRSPMAEGILKVRAPHLTVESRGVMAQPGDRTAWQTRRVLKQRLDLDLDQWARQITDGDCREADYVLTMTRMQADFIRNLGQCARVWSLADFAGDTGDVPDPFGGALSDYEETFQRLEELIQKIIPRLEGAGEEASETEGGLGSQRENNPEPGDEAP